MKGRGRACSLRNTLVMGTRHLQWRSSSLHKQFRFGNLNEASATNDNSLLWTFTQCGVLQKGYLTQMEKASRRKPNWLTVERLMSARLFFSLGMSWPHEPHVLEQTPDPFKKKKKWPQRVAQYFLNAPGKAAHLLRHFRFDMYWS